MLICNNLEYPFLFYCFKLIDVEQVKDTLFIRSATSKYFITNDNIELK